VAERLEADAEIDVILALNATIAGAPAVEAAKALSDRTVRVASFDVTDSMLNAVADGAASFVIDQQPFLQGYLPVQYLAVLAREGVVPVSNVSTGPRLIEESDAKKRLGRPVAADDSGATPPAEAEQSGG
jgi:simple sugar transport system substrate-binding protein